MTLDTFYSSKFWGLEAGAEWNHQQFLYIWSTGSLLQWRMGDCLW